MPSANTFSIKPIRDLILRHTDYYSKTIDPFARDTKLASLSNDINPATSAQYHLDAVSFLDLMLPDHTGSCDVALLDPPYSPRQVSECYKDIGRLVTKEDTQVGPMYNKVKDRIDLLLKDDAIVITCGWNSAGMGKSRGYEVVEILLVPHGGLHNDTIVTVERKRGLTIQ